MLQTASLILVDRLKVKEEKTKIINGSEWQGDKWIAILNNYWLASSETYKRALNNINVNHTFSNIFVVEENYKVTEIYSNN